MLYDWAFAQKGFGIFVIPERGDMIVLEYNEFLGRIADGRVLGVDTVTSQVLTQGLRVRVDSLRVYAMVMSGEVRTDDLPRRVPDGVLATGALAEALLAQMEETISSTVFYFTGGTIPPDAPSYIPRQADAELLTALRRGELCYVLNARQMGKSSLCVRTRATLENEGVRTTFLDLQKFGSSATAEQWYRSLLERIGHDLKLRVPFLTYWRDNAERTPIDRLFGALRDVALEQLPDRLVLFLDEIDVVRDLDFKTDEFFAAIRQCYNARAQDPAFARLTFCIIGTVAPTDLIRDVRLSPFNIGTRIRLADFTASEAAPLATHLSGGTSTLQRVLWWTAGHPYLTQRLCAELSKSGSGDVDGMVAQLFMSRSDADVDENIKNVRNTVLRMGGEGAGFDRVDLLTRYGQIVKGKRVPDDDTDGVCTALRLSGLVKSENGLLHVRNRVYAKLFDGAWVAGNLPDAELRRQRSAFRRGLALASALAGLVLAIIGTLAAVAIRNAHVARAKTLEAAKQRDEVTKQRDAAQYLVYVADMNLILPSYEQNDFGRVHDLLEETRTSKYRGFEWDYWNRLCHLDLFTLKGHSDSVYSVAFSPDGKRIVTGSADKTAKVWDAITGHEVLTLKGHSDQVNSVAFSPDGKRIVTGSSDKTAKVWNAVTGREVLTLKGHSDQVNSVAFSPDGKHIVTGSGDKTARVWDAATGRKILTLKHDRVLSVAFSPDGKRIVTGSGDYSNSQDDNTARVWDAITGHKLLTLKGHSDYVFSVAFSPDGKRIVTGSWDKTAKTWDAATGHEVLTLHTDGVYSVAFSPDGKRLVTGNDDGAARVWDATTGHKLLTLKGHSDVVNSVAFSPDGKRIVTGSTDKTAKVWNAATGHEVLTLHGHSHWVFSVAFSPDGKRVVTGSDDNTAKVWDAVTGREEFTLKGHSYWVYAAAFSPDGKRIVTGSFDKTAKVWDAGTGREILTLRGHHDPIWSVAFSPDGKRIVTGSGKANGNGGDTSARVWNAATGHEVLTLKGHTNVVLSVAFSPDGKRIVTGSADKTVKFWDAATGHEEKLTLNRHIVYVTSAAFSPDGKRLVTGGWDKTATVWDAITGQELLTLKGHSKDIESVAFSPDGKRIVTGSRDMTAKVWDAGTGREVLTLKGHSDQVQSVAFSPDGKRIVTGSFDHTAKIWDSR